MEQRFAPLPHEWMLIGIIGFFVSIFEIYPRDKTWGFTFVIFFILILIASVVSMTGAGTTEEELMELSVHERHVRAGEHRRSKH